MKWLSGSSQDHPRIRGEHFGTHRVPIDVSGSSPHTRGALSSGPPTTTRHRIIPAYAGSTSSIHTKGDVKSGSSPHTRGALDTAKGSGFEGRIIPAYAGSTSLVMRS